jgi:hypothetical protein
MREARYDDVWKYVSLRRDVMPRWPQIEPHLGRWQNKWRFLIEGWKERGLVELFYLRESAKCPLPSLSSAAT